MIDQHGTVADRALRSVEVVIREPVWLCGIRSNVELKRLRDYPYRILPIVVIALRRFGVETAGPPVCLFRPCGDGRFDVTAACPTRERVTIGQPFRHARLPGGPAAQVTHLGSWSTLLFTYDRLSEWLTAHRVPAPSVMWEEYQVGPELTGDLAAWRTRIVVPLPALDAAVGPDDVHVDGGWRLAAGIPSRQAPPTGDAD